MRADGDAAHLKIHHLTGGGPTADEEYPGKEAELLTKAFHVPNSVDEPANSRKEYGSLTSVSATKNEYVTSVEDDACIHPVKTRKITCDRTDKGTNIEGSSFGLSCAFCCVVVSC